MDFKLRDRNGQRSITNGEPGRDFHLSRNKQIREGERPDGPLVGRYCGHTMPPDYMSLGSAIFVKFHADHSISYTGFRAQYSTGKPIPSVSQ